MSSIRITNFGGVKPRDIRGTGGPTRASKAIDTNLSWGSLAPWRYPAKVADTSHSQVCQMFQMDCDLIVTPKDCADFATLETDCRRVFSTGIMPWPAYATLPDKDDNCEIRVLNSLVWRRLGVPQPDRAPTVVSVDALEAMTEHPQVDYGKQIKRENRAYAYSFVNEYKEESDLSPPTQVFDADYDGRVTLGFNIPPLEEGYQVSSIYIYRLMSGFHDAENETESDYHFIAAIPYREGNFTFTDEYTYTDIDQTYGDQCNPPPLNCLMNITAMDNGVLVASEGKNLWFTEPWKPHAWACHINLEDCIKAIKVVGDTIYVATDGYPYTITGSSPDNDCMCCRNVTKHTTPAPIVSKNSMVTTNTGVMWATNMGLVRVVGGEIVLLTHSTFNEEDWQELFPAHIKAAFHKGQYFGFNGKKGFIYEVNDGVYTDSYLGEEAKFTELSLTPDAVLSNRNNILFMSFDGDIFKWNEADTFMPYTWTSKLHIEGNLQNFSTMKVVFKKYLRTRKTSNPVTVRLYADDHLLFERKVSCSRPFRLPKGYDALNWNIELQGTEEVMEVHMATSVGELTNMNNV